MSTNDLMLDVSQATELKLAFRRNGWNNAEIKTLSEGDILADVLKVIKGQAEIASIKPLIDCDVSPFIPNGWSVKEHKKGGLWKWNPQITLYLSKKQKKKSVIGYDLRKWIANQPVLNANVLDYLLAHAELIPEEWKNRAIYFWGTIYCDSLGNLCVRCLRRDDSEWYWTYSFMGNTFCCFDPAVLAN